MVGGSFTGLTVRTNDLLADAPSESATVMAIVAVPDWFAAGIRVSVRLGPLPPKTIFPSGLTLQRRSSDLTVKLSAVLSTSPMENGMAAVGVSSYMDWSGTLEMVGGSFTG